MQVKRLGRNSERSKVYYTFI